MKNAAVFLPRYAMAALIVFFLRCVSNCVIYGLSGLIMDCTALS